MSDFVLELKSIVKEFPGVRALDKVSFSLKAGEIHALMGENGAGKSTFIKIITGVHQPDEGEIFMNGEIIKIETPKVAQKLGIAAIYQHVTCYPDLNVTENIFIGHEKIDRTTKRILWEQMHAEANLILKDLGANFGSKTLMGSLSVAQQQIVEIAKAISTKAKIIIMDEPTASLTKNESEELYKISERLWKSGVSIIFISHRMEDVYRLASRVSVFRDASYIGTWDMSKISKEKLISEMVGREITELYPKKESKKGDEVLRVEKLGKTGQFNNVTFSLNEGEIVGITGLVGAGRTELCQAICGITTYDAGSLFIRGKLRKCKTPLEAIELGIGYLPEDRQKQGLVMNWDIGRNITLSILNDLSGKGWLNRTKEDDVAKSLAELVRVKANSIFESVESLSGGNQQKVIVAKLLAAKLKILILDEPTKGVDVGAKAAIHEIISNLACQGYGIILISSEMPEVLGMSDRIIVMREGKTSKILDIKEATQENILEAAMAKEETISA